MAQGAAQGAEGVLTEHEPLVRWFDELSVADTPAVGGKNSSLGEMTRALRGSGIHVPDGFATTAAAYRQFLDANALGEHIRRLLDERQHRGVSLRDTGAKIREAIGRGRFPDMLANAIRAAYGALGDRAGSQDPDVAVRSSATAEDLPTASFAGQQEIFLNVRGEDQVLVEALASGKLLGVGLDVLPEEAALGNPAVLLRRAFQERAAETLLADQLLLHHPAVVVSISNRACLRACLRVRLRICGPFMGWT